MFKIKKLILPALVAIIVFNTGMVFAGDWFSKIKDHFMVYEDSKYGEDKEDNDKRDRHKDNHKDNHKENHKENHKDKHKDKRPDKLVAKLLQPRSLPYALQAKSGEADVFFSVRLQSDEDAKYVVLRERGNDCEHKQSYSNGHYRHDYDKHGHDKDGGACNVHILNDKGRDGDKVADDHIYGATISIDTRWLRSDDCLVYEAVSQVGKHKLKSPAYALCVSAFPTGVAGSDTRPENLIEFTDSSPAVADELLVRFDGNTTDRQIRAIVNDVGAAVVGSILPRNLYQIRFPQSLPLELLADHIETLRNNPRVESAYLNRVGGVAAVPNDPQFPNQHGLQWINAHEAWDLGATGSGVTVTLLDTGIATHADLPIAGADPLNHGTAVAGVIAANTDNAAGVAGVAYDSGLESFIVSADASVTITELIDGFQSVAASGTGEIVTVAAWITLAPPGSDFPGFDDQWDLCAAVNDVVLNGSTPVAVVVAAAGNGPAGSVALNDGSDGWHYPSRCNDSTAAANSQLTNKSLFIPVMASYSCNGGCTPDTRHLDSNYGAWIDVAAPGYDIWTTNNAGGYGSFTGTSMAMAMVAGSAAQLRSCGVPLNQIQSRLQSSAPASVSTPSGNKPRIDARQAVVASNTAPTNISISNTSVDENINTTGGYPVGTLTVVDANSCDSFTYNIQGGADAARFSIGGSGMNELILTHGVLNFEAKSSYAVTVRVTDSGGLMFNRAFTISVNDLNETPNVNNQVFSINENSANGSAVGTVAATDPDGDTLTYSIIGGNTGGAFAINAASGQITVASSAALNHEATASFALTVRVSDGVLNDTATTTVNVNDVNEAPNVNNQTFAINENRPNGFVVGTVAGTDPDGDTLSYSITAGNTGGAFAINAGSGQITVANSAAVNHEVNPSFALTVAVTDGVLNDTAAVTVNVSDLNEVPNVNNQTFSINENAANGSAVGTVSGTDPDGDTLSYSISAGNTGGAFAINATSGQITVANSAALNHETTPSFALTVTASDGTLTDTATVTVNVNDVNETPNVNNQTFSINENAANGSVVGTVAGTDPDGDTLAYSITAGNTGGAFAINASSGQITVANSAALNHEATPSFSLTVSVSDGVLNDTATVTVNVNDVNETPNINNQTFSINENAANGSAVGTIPATDPDGDTLAYSITAGNTGGAFAINASGQITVANSGAVNHEVTPSFALTVTVSDGVLTDNAAVTVNVNDVNETPNVNN
ncbi:MAG TPA: cadherin domain-containing protein, partial [Gammaproteobacteria bacterium]